MSLFVSVSNIFVSLGSKVISLLDISILVSSLVFMFSLSLSATGFVQVSALTDCEGYRDQDLELFVLV